MRSSAKNTQACKSFETRPAGAGASARTIATSGAHHPTTRPHIRGMAGSMHATPRTVCRACPSKPSHAMDGHYRIMGMIDLKNAGKHRWSRSSMPTLLNRGIPCSCLAVEDIGPWAWSISAAMHSLSRSSMPAMTRHSDDAHRSSLGAHRRRVCYTAHRRLLRRASGLHFKDCTCSWSF